jgi:hypothetical protein
VVPVLNLKIDLKMFKAKGVPSMHFIIDPSAISGGFVE